MAGGPVTANAALTAGGPAGNIVVAIDGPSGSGKSTVSREAARRLGWHLLDTGSVYRALAWYGLHRGIDLVDQDAVAALLPDFFAAWCSPPTRSARIRRRLAEKAGEDAAAVAASVAARDARDGAVVNFTTAADGVVELDTTHLDLEQAIAAVLDLIRTGSPR